MWRCSDQLSPVSSGCVADLMAPGEKSVGTGVEGETRSSSHGSSPSDIERNSDKEWGVRDSAESTWRCARGPVGVCEMDMCRCWDVRVWSVGCEEGE